jgi:hypothetical protein
MRFRITYWPGTALKPASSINWEDEKKYNQKVYEGEFSDRSAAVHWSFRYESDGVLIEELGPLL